METIQAGGKVYAHCHKGRHRAPAMGASILIALGYDPDEAIELIMAQRPIADPNVFYIRSVSHVPGKVLTRSESYKYIKVFLREPS